MEDNGGKGKLRWGHMPFVRFLCFAIFGVILSCCVVPGHVIYQVIRISCMCLLLGCLLSLSRSGVFIILFLLFVMLVCWGRAWEGHPAVEARHFSRYEAAYLYGYVADEPIQGEERVRFRFRVTGGGLDGQAARNLTGNIQVIAEGRYELNYGDQVLIPAQYDKVPGPRNPGEMDYAAHLAKQNCWHQAYLNREQLQLIPGSGGHVLTVHALKFRQQMVAKFARYMPDREDTFAIASTLILGYRADLSRELLETYSATGTIHVLSVSGMHVVIVFWLLARMLFWMDRRPLLKALRCPLLILAVWAYAFLTGLSPSVLRAAMMLSFVLWATAGSRRSSTYNNIAASAFFLLFWDPKLLLNLGFQLSYLAVVGIVFLNPLLLRLIRIRSRLIRPVTDYSAMSVAAQAGAFPLAMFYFQQFPVYFLLANLVIVLPATGIMYLGFTILLLPQSPVTDQVLQLMGELLSGLIHLMNVALYGIQALPAASLTGIEISWWQCLLIYALMLTFIFAWLRRSGSLFFLFLIIGLSLLLFNGFQAYRKWNDETLIVHQVRSHLLISYTGRGKLWLYTDLPDPESHSSFRYSVMPHLRSFRSSSPYEWTRHGNARDDPDLWVEDGLIQFGKHRIAIVEGSGVPGQDGRGQQMQNPPGPGGDGRLEVDLLLIRKNPRQDLEEIVDPFTARKLIFDGSNYPRTVSRLVSQAEALGMDYYVLKDNFAYVWVMD